MQRPQQGAFCNSPEKETELKSTRFTNRLEFRAEGERRQGYLLFVKIVLTDSKPCNLCFYLKWVLVNGTHNLKKLTYSDKILYQL